MIKPRLAGPTVRSDRQESSSLSQRLHQLETILEPVAAASAHPSELFDLPEFVEAVGLLHDADVPLQTVTQYALGDNLSLSCVGLAALARRADAGDALEDVKAFLDNMPAWSLYFAFQTSSEFTSRCFELGGASAGKGHTKLLFGQARWMRAESAPGGILASAQSEPILPSGILVGAANQCPPFTIHVPVKNSTRNCMMTTCYTGAN